MSGGPSMAEHAHVVLERRGPVALLTLNRPERLNAFAAATNRRLLALLDEVARDESVRAVLLTGAGRGFCAGADLKALAGVDGARDDDWGSPRGMMDAVARLRSLPQPSACAVNGVAAGAGFGLALAADLRVASRAARFVASQIRTAQVPDAGLSFFLPRLVGEERALRIALLADPIDAPEALALGLVGEVVEPDELVPRALALAERLAALPRTAARLTREVVRRGAESDLEAALDAEYQALVEANRDPDVAEAVRAFVEKRPPRFR
ncbi:MAG: enoyl-CoA hydratase-related protein [Thermodesulfobacteriota bacterium]